MRLVKRRAEYEMYSDVILVCIKIFFLLFLYNNLFLDDRINELFT